MQTSTPRWWSGPATWIDPSFLEEPGSREEAGMLLTSDHPIDRKAFERGTGWELSPEGACRGEVCVPLPDGAADGAADGAVDVDAIAERLGMPLVRHSADLAALGPATLGGRVLPSADAPELVLPDFDGRPFDLASLRGQKVVLVAWSPY